jgi:hypothetical protein
MGLNRARCELGRVETLLQAPSSAASPVSFCYSLAI